METKDVYLLLRVGLACYGLYRGFEGWFDERAGVYWNRDRQTAVMCWVGYLVALWLSPHTWFLVPKAVLVCALFLTVIVDSYEWLRTLFLGVILCYGIAGATWVLQLEPEETRLEDKAYVIVDDNGRFDEPPVVYHDVMAGVYRFKARSLYEISPKLRRFEVPDEAVKLVTDEDAWLPCYEVYEVRIRWKDPSIDGDAPKWFNKAMGRVTYEYQLELPDYVEIRKTMGTTKGVAL